MDSLKHVEPIVALETRFGVELTAEEIERLTCKQRRTRDPHGEAR
jgi:acyl carrier protein